MDMFSFGLLNLNSTKNGNNVALAGGQRGPIDLPVALNLPTMNSPSRPLDRPVRSQYEDFMRHVYTTGVQKGD
ncbi:MAG: hypothetical protein RLZZ95_1106, partial [Pseudomonadota bacterium]